MWPYPCFSLILWRLIKVVRGPTCCSWAVRRSSCPQTHPDISVQGQGSGSRGSMGGGLAAARLCRCSPVLNSRCCVCTRMQLTETKHLDQSKKRLQPPVLILQPYQASLRSKGLSTTTRSCSTYKITEVLKGCDTSRYVAAKPVDWHRSVLKSRPGAVALSP